MMLNLFKLMMITLIALIGLLLFGHFFLKHNAEPHLSQLLSSGHWIFVLWRYAIYACIFLIWSYFIKKIGIRQDWKSSDIDYFAKQRINLLILFILVEVFFVYNLIGHLLSWV